MVSAPRKLLRVSFGPVGRLVPQWEEVIYENQPDAGDVDRLGCSGRDYGCALRLSDELDTG